MEEKNKYQLPYKVLEREKAVMDSIVDKILINLNVLSQLQIGDKLDFSPYGSYIIQKPTWVTKAKRFVKYVDRWITLDQISHLINLAEGISEERLSDFRIRDALISSIHGLRNLQKTYETDITFRSGIEVLIQKLEIKYGVGTKPLFQDIL